MTKTFARNSFNNENFAEIPDLAVTHFNSSDPTMSRTAYQVNSSANTLFNGNSNTHLYESERRKPFLNSRIIGVIFLLLLVLASIGFLTFAIFYGEIIDDNNDYNKKQNEYKPNLNTSQTQFLLHNLTEVNTTTELSSKILNTLTEENYISIINEDKTRGNKSLKNNITFENFINGDFTPKTFNGKWISGNELLHYDSQNNLCITNVSHMEKTILITNETIKRFHLSGLTLSADRKYLVATYDARKVFRYSIVAKHSIFSINDSQLYPPLSAPETPHELLVQFVEWGPIGSQLIFIHRNNIYYKSDADSDPIRLTKSGEDLTIYNGIPDWVYEEEIVCGSKTFWLSPDGQKLVYATINDSAVDIMSWPYYGPYRENDETVNQYTRIVSVRYPKPGRRNPSVNLYLITLTDLKPTNVTLDYDLSIEKALIRLKLPEDIEKLGDHYFTAFKWIDNERFAINWMTRAQNLSVMTVYSETNRWEPISNFKLESKIGWIDLFIPPLITSDKKSYLIRIPKMSVNKRDYFTHIAKVPIKSSEIDYLTSGLFEVKQIMEINPKTERVYFTATFPKNPGEKHLMSVSLNESESEPICHTCLINEKNTEEDNCLVSKAEFSLNAEYYILQCQGPSVPRTEIYKTENDSLIHTLQNNLPLKYDLQQLSLPSRILIKVPSVGKNDIDVMLIVPEDFDAKSSKKYPIIFHVYGGPGSDYGSITQSYLYNEFSAFMASNKSIIYALIDARGSPNHGCKFMYDIYRKMGSVEVEDTIAVARYFRDNISYIDRDMISIWGWSYGGYLTTMAMIMDHNDTVFKCGVAVAPVSDWMLYDSVYVERFMGFPTPEDNLENYKKSSTLDKVKYLNGKQFLIMFGTADDNVHSQNSMMLMKAMNEANIKYDTQIYPDNNHNLHHSIAHMYRKMTDFLDKCYEKK